MAHPSAARLAGSCIGAFSWGSQLATSKAVNIIAVLLIGFLLTVCHAAFAQNVDEATALNGQMEVLYRQGRYSEAMPLAQRILAIREKALGPNDPDVAESLNNLALLYRIQGRYADAEPLFKRSLAIAVKAFGPDHPNVAVSLNNLSDLYFVQSRYTDAEPLYKRSLAIREKAFGPIHPDVAESLNNLALLYRVEERYADAEPLYKRALAINEKTLGRDHPSIATSLNNLGELNRAIGRYADAERLHKHALAIREETLGPEHTDVATSLNNLALLYRVQGRYADAEALFKRSLTIWEKVYGRDHPNVATSFNNLASLYQEQKRYAEAESLYKQSVAIWEIALGPDHPNGAATSNNLADLYRAQGRYADALPIVQRTNGARKDVALGVFYHSQLENLISSTQALYASYNVLQRSSSSAAGKAISMLAARFAAGSGELAQLVRKDQDLTAESDRLDKDIIAAVSKPPTERNAAAEERIRKRIDEIRLERAQLQEAFNQRFPDYVELSKPQPLSLRETQLLLDDDEALVAFDLDKTSYVWVITRNRAEWKALSVGAEDVSKAVAKLRVGLDPESPKPFDRNVAYQLYRQVLGPIEQIISGKPRLLFVLSGALTSLPPQVLITSDPENRNLASIDWLVRKYAITVLPSVASLKFLRGGKSVVAAAKPMIGFGDPIFDRSAQTGTGQKAVTLNRSLTAFYRGIIADTKSLAQALPPLPETADELRAVAKELGASSEDIHLGDEASVPNVRKWPLNIYHVVYFATHALVAGEVEKFAKVKAEPALVLSIPDRASEDDDGLLRASDVAMLKLNADFVVLSACNTAAGDKPRAEALSGLARAFFYAGARSLIVSNWEVDSESTVALMTGFFDALNANPHLSHSEALRLSMLIMIDHPLQSEWSQPKYWAPFIVVGEPRKN